MNKIFSIIFLFVLLISCETLNNSENYSDELPVIKEKDEISLTKENLVDKDIMLVFYETETRVVKLIQYWNTKSRVSLIVKNENFADILKLYDGKLVKVDGKISLTDEWSGYIVVDSFEIYTQ